MSTKNDKWVMFRNYMHNELGITKEDIREWIDDAIKVQIKSLVDNSYKKCDLESIIKREVFTNDLWGRQFKDSIRQEVGKILSDRIEVTLK